MESGAHVNSIKDSGVPNDRDDGATALFVACRKGYADIVRFLVLEAKADVNKRKSELLVFVSLFVKIIGLCPLFGEQEEV